MTDSDLSRTLRFWHRGQTVRIPLEDPTLATRSVLQWLRGDAHACGTKEGCAEGDCGACTVLVAELAPEAQALPQDAAPGAPHPALPGPLQAQGLHLRPVNACIRFLPTLDGRALLTVEDLAAPGAATLEGLHPAQRALVAHHGSQCGFCTPGFAVTLAAVDAHHRAHGTRPSRPELADALAGNLCRCTGYRPILDAGEAMLDLPARTLPLDGLADTLRAWRREREGQPLHWPGHWHSPRDAAALAQLKAERPEARLLAGGTDIGLWVNKQFRDLGEVVWLGEAQDLQTLATQPDGWLRIGAAVPLQDAWGAIAADWPALATLARRFAGPPVRHAGTLCGNLANGSPIGDAAPALMALDARLRLRRGGAVRSVPLTAFYLDYMRNDLQPGEFVEAVELPRPAALGPGWRLQAHKLSKRFDCDISGLSAGFALRLSDDGHRVEAVRLAFGGLAGTVRRAAAAEAALVGQPWTLAQVQRAQAALAQDFQPLTDLRASAGYRLQAARALLLRLWMAQNPGPDALPAADWDVFDPDAGTA